MSGRKPNAPAGVVRSPSCLFVETPRCPSHAVHGPAAALQQPPLLRQSRSAPCVELRRAATTVRSWSAEPVDSRFARLSEHAATVRPLPAAEAATASARMATSAIHLIPRADYVPMALALAAFVALQPPFTHTVSRVTAAQLHYSWRPVCPVAPAQLRRVRLTYWGFDGDRK